MSPYLFCFHFTRPVLCSDVTGASVPFFILSIPWQDAVAVISSPSGTSIKTCETADSLWASCYTPCDVTWGVNLVLHTMAVISRSLTGTHYKAKWLCHSAVPGRLWACSTVTIGTSDRNRGLVKTRLCMHENTARYTWKGGGNMQWRLWKQYLKWRSLMPGDTIIKVFYKK